MKHTQRLVSIALLLCFCAVLTASDTSSTLNDSSTIPPDYLRAMRIWQQITNASMVSMEQSLFNLKSVRVACIVDDAIKEVSKDELKTKIELTLRRNNVRIDTNAPQVIVLRLGGLYSEQHSTLAFTLNFDLADPQVIWHSGQCHRALVTTWNKEWCGVLGKQLTHDKILEKVESFAEAFANDFLAANPK